MKCFQIICLLVLATTVNAHVRGMYSGLNIRNAASPTGDGAFSTAGPCGGAGSWGANGFSVVGRNSALSLSMRYNGGHDDPANNFKLTARCGEPAETALRLPDARLGTAEVDVDDQSAVYSLSFSMDQVAGAIPGAKCTVAIVDQRNWGACADIEVGADELPPGSDPIVDLSGTYSYTTYPCDRSQEGAGCCCQTGTIEVVHDTALNSARATLSAQVVNQADGQGNDCTADRFTMVLYGSTILLTSRVGVPAILEGELDISGERFQVSVTQNAASVSNISPESPQLCSMPMTDFVPAASPEDDDPSPASVIAPMCAAVGVAGAMAA